MIDRQIKRMKERTDYVMHKDVALLCVKQLILLVLIKPVHVRKYNTVLYQDIKHHESSCTLDIVKVIILIVSEKHCYINIIGH